jgi:UDP-N-acetylglucosamine 2-epimerase (non-hydrolysing)
MSASKNKLKILSVVGARPNFVKIAPLVHEMKKHDRIEHILMHTGQHYDKAMNDVFFENLNMPHPDVNLNVGSGSREFQLEEIAKKFEPILEKIDPDLVVVVGDVNSTLACAEVAKRHDYPVAHVEAGLRSYDLEMPEEINRVATDKISDYLLLTEESAKENLSRENLGTKKIHFVGNVMIDSLVSNLASIEKANVMHELGLEKKGYFLLTLHRPSNVDSAESFTEIVRGLELLESGIKIVFPAHPRTKKMIEQFNLQFTDRFIVVDAMPYIDFLNLTMNAKAVFTDSGGVQEETTFLKVPCVTLRKNTERPVTIDEGTNVLSQKSDSASIEKAYRQALIKSTQVSQPPKLWDGKAAERIVQIFLENL